MSDLQELIQYWKDELRAVDRVYQQNYYQHISSTIAYLERLSELWKEK